MRIPILSAVNDLIEAKAARARASAAEARVAEKAVGLMESSWSQYVDEEDDASQWSLVSNVGKVYSTAWESKVDSVEYLDQLRSQARWLVQRESLGRSPLNAFVTFIWGTGPRITPNDDNPQHEDVLKDFCERQHWFSFGRQVLWNVFRDGEAFIVDRREKANGRPRFALLDPNAIRQPLDKRDTNCSYGIETDP